MFRILPVLSKASWNVTSPPVWKSTSELGYPEKYIVWTFVNLHAIEQRLLRGQRRVDGVETPRHGADAATEARCVDGVGRLKFDFHTDHHQHQL